MEISKDEDLQAREPRRPLRKLGDLPRLVDEDRGAVTLHENDIGMASRKDIVTRRAIATPPVRTDERGCEGPSSPALARTGRTEEEEGVHGRRDERAEHRPHTRLPDDPVEDG